MNFHPIRFAKGLRLAEVLLRVPVSKSNWWAGVKSGRYPAPVYVSPRVPVWREEDIDGVLDGRWPERRDDDPTRPEGA